MSLNWRMIWISSASLAVIAGIALAPNDSNKSGSTASVTAVQAASSPVVRIKPGDTATVVGPPVISSGDIISIPVKSDRNNAPLNPILCIKCRAALYVPNVGDKVSLEWITFQQNPNAPPVEFLTATEYNPGHHP